MIIQTAGTVTVGGETIRFGEPVRTREAFIAFPEGTVVDWQQTGQCWTKMTQGQWQQDGRTAPSGASDASMSLGYNHLVSMPVEAIVVDGVTLTIGGRMSLEQLTAAPPGTVVRDPGHSGPVNTLHKTDRPGRMGHTIWTYWGPRGAEEIWGLSDNWNFLVSVPGFEVREEVPTLSGGSVTVSMGWTTPTTTTATGDLPFMRMQSSLRRSGPSLEALKQDLGRAAVNMAVEYSKPLPPVYEALTDLGIGIIPVAGEVVSPALPLPDDTILIHSEPGNPAYTMWVVREGAPTVVVGTTDITSVTAVVVAEPPEGVEPFVRRTSAEGEAERIAAWKAEVWEKGWRHKNTNDWCSAFETLLCNHGITAAEVGAATPTHGGPFGTFPTGTWPEVRDLPFGAVVARVGAGDKYRITLHREGAGWRKVAGESGFNVLRTHVLFDGHGGMAIQPPSTEFMDLMPVGTTFTHCIDYRWEKRDDGLWYDLDNRTGVGTISTAFDPNNVSIIRIGDNHDRSAAA